MIGGSHFRLPWAARDPLRREEKMAARSPLLNHPHNCSQKGRSTKACPQRTDDILGLGGLFEPSHQPRKNTGRRRDGRGDAVARRLAGVVLINDHSDDRHKSDDQGAEGAERASHWAMIAFTLRRVACFQPTRRPLLHRWPRTALRPSAAGLDA
jgi:hypothetical protein